MGFSVHQNVQLKFYNLPNLLKIVLDALLVSKTVLYQNKNTNKAITLLVLKGIYYYS